MGESKATTAEKLILMLRQQIGEARAAQGGLQKAAYLKEAEKLKADNLALKAEVELWKSKLSKAEQNNGKMVLGATKPVNPKTDCILMKAEAPAAEEKKKEDAPKKEIDVGEEKPRTVISGLVKFIPEAEMQDRMAVLLCNLKPSKMRGIMSEAMVMCASTPEKVEILAPPPGAKPGDVVEVKGFIRAPDAQLNPKKKIFEAVAPDLLVNSAHQATYKGELWTVNDSPVTSQTLAGVNIK